MRNLLFVALVLALSVGLVFFLRDSGQAQDNTAVAATAENAAAQTNETNESPVELNTDGQQLSPEPGRLQPEARREALGNQRADEREAAQDPQAGYGVTGIVTDSVGNPVANALVLASGQSFMPLDLKQPADWMPVTQEHTDSEGRFEVLGIAPKDLRLAIRAPGFAPLDRDRLGLPDEAEAHLEPLVLERGAILSGRVTDRSGRGLQGAELVTVAQQDRVRFLGPNLRRPAAVADANGDFTIDMLAVGPWALRVDHPEHPSKVFEGVAPEAGVQAEALEFQLDLGGSIAGRVVGFPDAVALIVTANPGDDFFGAGTTRETEVQPSGDFLLDGLQLESRYTLRLRNKNSANGFFDLEPLSKPVRAQTGDRGVTIEYNEGSIVTMRLVDAKTGAPIERLQVEAGVNWSQPVDAPADGADGLFPDGIVRVEDLHFTNADDALVLNIKSPGYEPYDLAPTRLEPGESRDLGNVALDPVPTYVVTVMDAISRAPVKGASVTAQESQPEPDPSQGRSIRRSLSMRIGDSEDADSEQVVDRFLSDQASSSGQTDASGVAVLNAIDADLVGFSATAKGYAKGKLEGIQANENGTTEVTLLLSKGGSVAVTVLEADGSPAAGRSVEHRGPRSAGEQGLLVFGGSGDSGARTDAEGSVLFENLELGSHRFRIAKQQSGGALFSGASIVVGTDADDSTEDWTTAEVSEGTTQEVVLTAPPTGSLTGTITEAGLVLAGASLSIEEAKAGNASSFGFPGIDLGGGIKARTGAQGGYSFENLEEGTYALTIKHATRRMPTEFDVEVRPGANSFDVDLAVSILQGRVTDGEGAPVAGASVTAKMAQQESSNGATAMFVMASGGGTSISIGGPNLGGSADTTDEHGRYTLRGVLADTPLSVHVEGDSFQPADSEPVEVAPNETLEAVNITLEPGGRIAVQARSAGGDPVGRMLAIARREGDTSGSPPSTAILEEGACELTGLTPGQWTVRIQSIGPGSGNQDDPQSQTINVVAGETANAIFDLP